MNALLTPAQQEALTALLPQPSTFEDAVLLGLGRYSGAPMRAFWLLNGIIYSTNLEGYNLLEYPNYEEAQMSWWKVPS